MSGAPDVEEEPNSGLRLVEEAPELRQLLERVDGSAGEQAEAVFPRFAQIVSPTDGRWIHALHCIVRPAAMPHRHCRHGAAAAFGPAAPPQPTFHALCPPACS